MITSYAHSDDYSTATRCQSLIARYCPGLMRTGGGALHEEPGIYSKRLDPDERAQIQSRLRATAGSLEERKCLALEFGVGQTAIRRIWQRMESQNTKVR